MKYFTVYASLKYRASSWKDFQSALGLHTGITVGCQEHVRPDMDRWSVAISWLGISGVTNMIKVLLMEVEAKNLMKFLFCREHHRAVTQVMNGSLVCTETED